MSCSPALATADHILTTPDSGGWVTLTGVVTSALLANYGLSTAVLSFPSIATQPNQHLVLEQVEIEETAATSGDIKKADIKLLFYTSTPSSPSTSAAYNGSTTGYMGQVTVDDTEYARLADTIWHATKNCDVHMRTGTGSTPSTIYVVVLAAQSVTYVSGVAVRVKVTFKVNTNL